MAFTIFRRRKTNSIWVTVTLALVFFYFSYHAVSGHSGLLTMLQLKQHIEKSKEKLEKLEMEKMQLEHRVSMISKEIDIDLLDEQSRKIVGHAGKNETIYLIPEKERYMDAEK